MKKQIIILILFILFPCIAYSQSSSPWKLTLEVTGGNLKSSVSLGAHTDATDTYDSRFDIIAFSPANTTSDYLFPSLFLNPSYSLGRQINSSSPTGRWDLFIETSFPLGTVVTLAWGSLPVNLSALQLTLADDQTSTVVDMQQTNAYAYTVTAKPQTRYFQIDLAAPVQDTDGDGMPDWWETQYGLDLTKDTDAGLDNDGDGLANLLEYQYGTDPTAIDTDRDGISDGMEITYGLNPLDSGDALLDSDGDGISNLEEIRSGGNPRDPSDNIPVANAGSDQTSDPSPITLDGTGSTDPNSDSLAYAWTQSISNPVQATFTDNGTAAGSTQNLTLADRGQYAFTLVVSDGKASSLSDTVLITITNVPPTSDAGDNQSVDTGALVSLDGSGSSDANGDSLTFAWTQTSGPSVSLTGATTVSPTFTPQQSGIHTFLLIVSDGQRTGSPDSVIITVNTPNIVPTADAGQDQAVQPGVPVTLNGTGSTDSDRGPKPLSHTWLQTGGPSVSLTGATTASPTFTPQQSGIYTFLLTVSDDRDTSAPDSVNIIAISVPVANAGSDQTGTVGDAVMLGGGLSYDDNAGPNPLGYQWTQTRGTAVTLSDPTGMTPTFIPLYAGILDFQLIVSDGQTTSLPDSVAITIESSNNRLPVANAGPDIIGSAGELITLNGTASYDPDGDPVTHAWTQTGGGNITLAGATTATPSFTPLIAGIYAFSLTVQDSAVSGLPAEVVITVNDATNMVPVSHAGQGAIVSIGAPVTLDGAGSFDPDGDAITYAWAQTKGPVIILSDHTAAQPTFTPARAGVYAFALTVNDGQVNSRPKEATIYALTLSSVTYAVITNQNTLIQLTGGDLAGVSIRIPEGAVTSATQIGISIDRSTLSALPSSVTPLSDPITLIPNDILLLKPIDITLPITQPAAVSSHNAKAIKTENGSVGAYTYNKETTTWEYLADAKDAANGAATFSTMSLSQYVIGNNAAAASASPPAEEELTLEEDGGGSCFISISGEGSVF